MLINMLKKPKKCLRDTTYSYHIFILLFSVHILLTAGGGKKLPFNMSVVVVVSARWVGLSISVTADVLKFSCTTISKVYRESAQKNIQWATVL